MQVNCQHISNIQIQRVDSHLYAALLNSIANS